MLLKALVEVPWLAPVLWACLCSSDYTLTLIGAHLYRNGANNHLRITGSYELTPFFQPEIDRQRRFSSRYFMVLAVTLLLVILSRLILLSPPSRNLPDL